MSDLTWIPFFTLFRREIARFLKVVAQTVVTPIVTSLLYLLIFGVSLGRRQKPCPQPGDWQYRLLHSLRSHGERG